MSGRQRNAAVNEGTADEEITVGNSDCNPAVKENLKNVLTSERRFNEAIDREMGSIIDTVEDRIQSAILTAIGSIIIPKTELAFCVFWTRSDQCHGEFRTWGTHRDYCPFWKRIRKE